jgi:alpha-L-fucosidase
MLVDIVSKNGNLLLSVPVRGDGSIDEKELAILNDIKAWMDVNGTSIYATRPWKTFGEGPSAENAKPLHAQGFNENNNYSAQDVRFVQRNDTVFATIMRWPEERSYTLKSLGTASGYVDGEVKSVELLGYGAIPFINKKEGLVVTLPEENTNKIAPVLAVAF